MFYFTDTDLHTIKNNIDHLKINQCVTKSIDGGRVTTETDCFPWISLFPDSLIFMAVSLCHFSNRRG